MNIYERIKFMSRGLVFMGSLAAGAAFGDFALEKINDGSGKEIMFLVNGNTGDCFWCDSFVDDTNPNDVLTVRAWRKIEKDLGSELESYRTKKKTLEAKRSGGEAK
ncbi:MAG: hypothetical protein LBR62_03195 [Puniceicoccales bacterium]|jgi:hypothetical protein|nr:hypothetical protein [Puniceicoccales bacterium]